MTKVFISGCWDLFHVGHLECLQFAKAQGDHLTVSVASDATIRLLKREPIYSESERLEIIRGLACVDEAFIARGEPNNYDFMPYIYAVQPQVWVISWNDKEESEKVKIAKEVGCTLVKRHRAIQTPTTTSLIAHIKSS